MIRGGFFRNRGAYLVGRLVLTGEEYKPFVIALVNEPERQVWELLKSVPDPEIPALSIVDLGIVRHVRRADDGALRVGLTPTYSGCPATEVIRSMVRSALQYCRRVGVDTAGFKAVPSLGFAIASCGLTFGTQSRAAPASAGLDQ